LILGDAWARKMEAKNERSGTFARTYGLVKVPPVVLRR
jgi:hypothetical protein